jgi:GNAT superfamily N-acetyltransferase
LKKSTALRKSRASFENKRRKTSGVSMEKNGLKIEGPLHPSPRDYSSFLAFLSKAYSFQDPRWFEKDTPTFYGKSPDRLRTKWAFKVGNQFASHVGIFPFVSRIEGRKLKVAGIGSVATNSAFRGQGLMKRLMEHVEGEIQKEGYDLSILWGERGLYRPFGYERGFYQNRFHFTNRVLKYSALPRGVRPASRKDFPVLLRMHGSHPFHSERTTRYIQGLQRRFQVDEVKPIWVLEEKNKIFAYAVVLKSGPRMLDLAEWGGATEDVVCLLATLVQKQSMESLTACLYPGSGFYDWACENYENRVLSVSSCMIKVHRLAGVLKAFEPQLQDRYGRLALRPGRPVVLKLEGEEVSLVPGKKLAIVPGRRGSDVLVLDPSQCVRLLFGTGFSQEGFKRTGSGAGLLESLFPLRWHWWRSDWV